jgi:hypothetical protein
MERFLIVDSKRPWVDREAIQPTDRIIAHNEMTGQDHNVRHIDGLWVVDSFESTKVADFKDLFVYFRKGWKFFKLAEKSVGEPVLCASCGQFTVAKEGELCYACGHP